jgi:hypothetical protein
LRILGDPFSLTEILKKSFSGTESIAHLQQKTPSILLKGVYSSKPVSRVLFHPPPLGGQMISIINLALPLLTGLINPPIPAICRWQIRKRAASLPGPIWFFNS